MGGAFERSFTIYLDVVVTKKDGNPVADRARVDGEVALANQAFSSGDVRFAVGSFTTTDSIKPDVDKTVGNDAIFQPTKNLHVLYVNNLAEGGGITWSNGSGIVIATNGAHAILAHELGHALGLGHTYDADDYVADTQYDPGTCDFSAECYDATKCAQCSYSSCPPPNEKANPDPRNVMGPAVHPTTRRSQQCNTSVTPGQWELVHCTLRTMQKRLTCSLCGPGFTCGDDGTCACDKTVCGNTCVALGTNNNCTACGDKCLAGEQCRGRTAGCDDHSSPCPAGSLDCGKDCNDNQVCIPKNKPGGCPHFPCNR